MKGIVHLILILLLSLPLAAGAQILELSSAESDFQARTGFTFDKRVVKGLHIAWSEELRMKDDVTKVDRIYSTIALSYDIFPWLKAGADYTFIAVNQSPGWQFRNRGNFDVTFSYRPAPNWKLSLRERFRVTSTNKQTDPLTEVNPSWIMRSRLMAEYSIPCLPLKPYAYFELSTTLDTPPMIDNYIDKMRASVGIKYAVSPRSEIDLYYRFDHNRNKEFTWASGCFPATIYTEKQNNHILGLFYEYNF